MGIRFLWQDITGFLWTDITGFLWQDVIGYKGVRERAIRGYGIAGLRVSAGIYGGPSGT